MFNTSNPMLGDWQKVKSFLTEAQLEYTSKTKGAISDKEMMTFAKAVANDDIASISKMTAVFDKLNKFYDKEKNTTYAQFGSVYGANRLNEVLGGINSYTGEQSSTTVTPQQPLEQQQERVPTFDEFVAMRMRGQ